MMGVDGEKYHKAMVEFARECTKTLPEVVMTIVGMDDVDAEAAKAFVEREIGASFRIRPYF